MTFKTSKSRVIFSVLALLLSISAFAQNLTVTGTVTDSSTGQPVPFAAIQLKDTMTGGMTDADGNYYYKHYDLQKELQKLYADITPDGKQWDFDWSDMGMMMGLEHMYSVFDFGVSAPNYFMAGVDYEAIYGPDAAGMWVANIEGYYEIELTDETSGKIWLLQPDWESGDLVRVMYIEY